MKEIIQSATTKVVDFARTLRISGSDIVVEADLAEIFGRGKISVALEESFKTKVRTQQFTELYRGAQVELAQGPGPTLLRAFQEPEYFSTVLTLSMFGYFYDREELASLISWAISKRFELKIPRATCSPGFEAIKNTLIACGTQTADFHWAPYRQAVEDKLRSSIVDYHWSP
jgi:hypothetical protein